MKLLYPLTFEFGKLFKEPMTEKELALYLFIANKFIPGEEYQISKTDKDGNDLKHYTFPIYKNTEQEDPDYISEYFLKWCNEVLKITENNKLRDEKSLISIDIRGINREQQVYHLSWGIKRVLADEPNDVVRLILLCDKIPAKEDALFKHIYALINDGKIILIDQNGNSELKSGISAFNKEELISLMNNTDDNIIEKFKGKLIRKIGHFRINPKVQVCSKYFYDARYCEQEINKMMKDYVEKDKNLIENLEYILYSSKVSPWLHRCMSAFSGDLLIDRNDVFVKFKDARNIDTIQSDFFDNYSGGSILLVVDFINSAETLKSHIVKVFDRFRAKGLDTQKLKIVAILNNDTSDNRIKKISIINEEFDVECFLNVPQIEDPQEDCDKCKYKYKHNSVFEDEFIKLRSYDFWELAKEYGFEKEELKPDHIGRERINLVPSFFKWLETYAPYFAFKFKNYIEFLEINKQLNFAIIYPNEKLRAETGDETLQDSASSTLANKLNEIFGISVIGVPRYIIDGVKGKKLKMNDIKDNRETWKIRIVNMPPNTDIIILDEFLKDGGTLDSLVNILQWLNKPAKCFFSIADLNPEKSNSIKVLKEDFEMLSLYELNYN